MSPPAPAHPLPQQSIMTPEPLHLRPFVVEHFVKACSDPDSLTTLNAYKQLYFQRNGSKAKAQKSGGWKRSNEKTLANILLLGVIISSDVGSYGSSVNAKTLDAKGVVHGKRRFLIGMIQQAIAKINAAYRTQALNLQNTQNVHEGVPVLAEGNDGPSSPPRAGTVYSFVRPGDAEAPLQIQLVHNIFKDTAAPTGGGAADTKAFFQDTAVPEEDDAAEEDELTLANCPDPAGLYINADIKPARRRQIKYLTDVGVYNDQGDVVHPDELPVVLAPGTAVLVNANLRFFDIAGTRTYQVYWNEVTALGPAEVDVEFSESAAIHPYLNPPLSSSPQKHDRDDGDLLPSPKRGPAVKRLVKPLPVPRSLPTPVDVKGKGKMTHSPVPDDSDATMSD